MKRVMVVGGGFFGAYLAEYLALRKHRVVLVESEKQLMTRASFSNQARVHQGYHYPRSILTALRSRISFPRFTDEFRDCVVSDFEKYYLVGRPLGKVTGLQFQKFCERIGAPCQPAPGNVLRLINPALIDGAFSTVEFAFDAEKVRNLMEGRLRGAGVELLLGTSARRVEPTEAGLAVELSGDHLPRQVDHVFNCTYSRTNALLHASGIDLVPLKHEMTEMCLVRVPEEIKRMGITVMCGPFFSTMPFPPAGLHSFSHVRYTPHYEWKDEPGSAYRDAQTRYENDVRHSAWKSMQKDASRYVPILAECQYDRSLWEVKTLLPSSESDDSRPILFRAHQGLAGFHCVMGGKIDNVYDATVAVSAQLEL